MKRIKMFLMAMIVTLSITSNLQAAIPRLINYQGKLTDSSGKPIEGSGHVLTFRIYTEEGGGTPLWSQEIKNVSFQKGIFSTILDLSAANDVNFDVPYYLEIVVDSDVMSPRQRLTAAGYAIMAQTAETTKNAEQATTATKANTALGVEARTSDPYSPANGQIWLRTDL